MTAKQFYLSRARMLAFLGEIGTDHNGLKSVYFSAGVSLDDVKSRLEENFASREIPLEISGLIVTSKTGAVLFWGVSRRYVVLPPFPIVEEYRGVGYDSGRLRALIERDYRIALILVRLGSYAVGLCQGERLIASKVGTGLVHGRQRQGGSSAQRFQQRRKGQIESFLERVCGHIREKLGGCEPDFVAYGGARVTIERLQKECPFLSKFADRTLPPLLDIAEPRQAVLESAVGRVWSSKVIEWGEPA